MAGFEFKLEALLTHRRQAEKEKQLHVARIQQEILAVRRLIQDTQNRISTENRTLGTRELTGRLDMQYIAHQKRFVGALSIRILLATQKLEGLEQKLTQGRAELLAAARARKVIEKLRAKQFERWRAEVERREAAVVDEIGTQLAIRARTEGTPDAMLIQGAAG